MEKTTSDLDKELAVLRQIVDDHIEHSSKALDKAEGTVNERLEKMNEFRDQLKDQAKTFVTFDVYNAYQKSIDVKIEAIQKIVWGGLAIISFLIFAVPLAMHFIDISK